MLNCKLLKSWPVKVSHSDGLWLRQKSLVKCILRYIKGKFLYL